MELTEAKSNMNDSISEYQPHQKATGDLELEEWEWRIGLMQYCWSKWIYILELLSTSNRLKPNLYQWLRPFEGHRCIQNRRCSWKHPKTSLFFSDNQGTTMRPSSISMYASISFKKIYTAVTTMASTYKFIRNTIHYAINMPAVCWIEP